MKFRRHHNNKGYRQIQEGKCEEQAKKIAEKLGILYNERLIFNCFNFVIDNCENCIELICPHIITHLEE